MDVYLMVVRMGRAERTMTQQSEVKVGAGSYELNLSAVLVMAM